MTCFALHLTSVIAPSLAAKIAGSNVAFIVAPGARDGTDLRVMAPPQASRCPILNNQRTIFGESALFGRTPRRDRYCASISIRKSHLRRRWLSGHGERRIVQKDP